MASNWNLPIKAEWRRALTLEALVFSGAGLTVDLAEEDPGRCWRLFFSEVQAFRCTTEESSSAILAALPSNGALFELEDSLWLQDLGLGKIEFMKGARHYVICCYDEVVEVVATRHELTTLNTAAKTPLPLGACSGKK